MQSDVGPKVSIVICVYNGRRFLDRIFDYLKEQTYDDCETVFVVDGRSDDGTMEAVVGYCDGNDDARYVVNDSQTLLGGSKNLGLDESKGRYIWFLDVDDVPSLRFLETMMGIVESEKCDTVVTNFRYIDSHDIQFTEDGEVITMTGDEAVHSRSNNHIPVTSWSMLYDRELLQRTGIRFMEGMSEDIVFTYLVLEASDSVCFYTAPLYGHYLHSNSFCNSNKDLRGRTEMERYLYLSDHFTEEDVYLQKRLCLLAVRSMAHMTPSGFSETIKDEKLKGKIGKYFGLMGRFEYRVIRLFPRSYHFSVNWYIKWVYAKVGKIYTNKGKLRVFCGNRE